jgi:hypothetical protein
VSADSSQSWIPPHELMLPTPRPIKGREVVVARRIRTIGGILIFAGGTTLLGWLLLGLSWSAGTTIGIKWEHFLTGPYFTPYSMSLLIYEAVSLTWFVSLVQFRRTERLLNSGKPAAAVVIDIRKVRLPSLCDPDFKITFQFCDDTGHIQNGTISDRINAKEGFAGMTSSHFSVNQALTVLCDPAKPKKFLVYPPPGYEIGESVGA